MASSMQPSHRRSSATGTAHERQLERDQRVDRHATLAGNFQTFLTLLTTQLKNQNPLDPLDTNQFTQQLVQFASVEQQLKPNDQLATLVTLQKTTQSTAALASSATTAAVDGSDGASSTAASAATWTFNGRQATPTATITITNSTGQTVFSGTYTLQAGQRRPSPGTARAMTARSGRTATTRSRSPPRTPPATTSRSRPRSRARSIRSISPQSPPLLSIGGQSYTTRPDQARRASGAARASF